MSSLKARPQVTFSCEKMSFEQGGIHHRRFPDGETCLGTNTPVQNRHCVVLADLSHLNVKYLSLVFLPTTLREFGAASVGLVAPYFKL